MFNLNNNIKGNSENNKLILFQNNLKLSNVLIQINKNINISSTTDVISILSMNVSN